VALAMPTPLPGLRLYRSLPGWCYAAGQSGNVYVKSDVNTASNWMLQGTWDGTLGDPLDPSRAGTEVRRMCVNPLDSRTVYLLGVDKAARSTASGATWEVIDGSVDARLPTDCHSLCAHPTDGRTLFAARYGPGNVFVTSDEGAHWQSFHADLPTVSVEWLEARDGWLYASTYGRGLWRRRLVV